MHSYFTFTGDETLEHHVVRVWGESQSSIAIAIATALRQRTAPLGPRAAGRDGVHTAGDGGRPAGHAELQPHVPAGELPDEVLLLPHPVVAAAALRRGGLQQEDRRLRAGEDGGGGGGVPRPHHLAGRAAHAPQVRAGHQAHDGGAAVHAGRVRGGVCVAARAQEQPRRVPPLH